MDGRVWEGLLLVIPGMFMKTFISAAQEEKQNQQSPTQPGNSHGKARTMEKLGPWKRAFLGDGIPEAGQGQHSCPELTL